VTEGIVVRAREGRALWHAALALLIVGPVLALGACRSQPLLANTRSSDEATASAVLTALEHRDREALLALSVTQEEFETVVWPTLPASRPEVGMPSTYLWQDTDTRSSAHLDETLRRWGGRRLRLVRVEFGGATTEHGPYSLSRKTHLVVRDESGAELTVRLFGSMIRQGTATKVYSFIVD
jgi:hypothetical protein